VSAVSEAPVAAERTEILSAPRRWRLPLSIAAGSAMALVVFLMIRPMLWDHNFVGFDWYTHLWYIWHQEGSLRSTGLPSLFAHNSAGIFDSHYAFYGGTLYVIAGVISLVVGHVAAFVITWIGAFAMAVLGFFWLARQAGVGPLLSCVPGVLFVASPWWLSSIYAWGSWGQAVAVSALVLLVAAAVSILRSDRLRFGPAAALALSTTLYTGSHNLTMLWATTLSVIFGALLLVLVPSARRLFTWRGIRRLAVVMVPAVLVNAWFLLPDIAYQADTYISANSQLADGLVRTSMFYVTPDFLFSLHNKQGIPGFTHQSAQLPLLAVGWSLIALLVFRPRWRSPWLWTAGVLFLAAVTVWQHMTHVEWILGLPTPYDHIQAPYRFGAYITLAMAGLVICALALGVRSRGRRRYWLLATVPLVLFLVLQGKSLVDEPYPGPAYLPPWNQPHPYYTTDESPYGAFDYTDSRLPSAQIPPGAPTITFSAPEAEKHGRVSMTVKATAGQLFASNVKTSTWLIRIKGARAVANGPTGNAVLQVDRATNGVAKVTVEARNPWPVTWGRVISLVGIAGLLALAGVALRRRFR
jgi:hypothetical protein